MNICSVRAMTLLLFLPSLAFARFDEHQWCGSHGPELTRYLLKQHQMREAEGNWRQLASIQPIHQDIGEIAVLKANRKTIAVRNPFDLVGRKIIFARNNDGAFDIHLATGTIPGNQGRRIALRDDDFKEISFTSGFSFPYYGEVFTSVFVNSDGNLTFLSGDKSISFRDVLRALSGPPRISPFFWDLNPDLGGSIRVLQTESRFSVTWNDISEYVILGGRTSNTFQVSLLKNGDIEFVYGRVGTRSAVVGLSPGNTNVSNLRLVNWSKVTNLTGVSNAVMERFSVQEAIDFGAVVNEFITTHSDIYDFVVIFTDFPIDLWAGNAFAFYAFVFNDVKGIGLQEMNFRSSFATKKLQGILAMGNLGNYPDDPEKKFLFEYDTIQIIGQENAHRWLSFPTVSVAGIRASILLGRDFAHWNFYMDTDGSVMEGNDIRDNGDGTFTTVGANYTYSAFDEYIMGLLSAEAVPPTFVVDGLDLIDFVRPPETGVTVSGKRVDIKVQDIIAAIGPRIPNSSTSQKRFREAFILLTKKNNPLPADVRKVDLIRKRWQSFFQRETNNKGFMDTTLQ